MLCGSAACVALGGGGGGALLERPWCRLSASAPPANAAPERLGARLGAAARSRPAFMAARSSAATEPLPPTLLPITFSVFAQMIGEGIAISSLPLHGPPASSGLLIAGWPRNLLLLRRTDGLQRYSRDLAEIQPSAALVLLCRPVAVKGYRERSARRHGQVCCPALVSLSSRFGRALVLRVCLGGASLSSS